MEKEAFDEQNRSEVAECASSIGIFRRKGREENLTLEEKCNNEKETKGVQESPGAGNKRGSMIDCKETDRELK